MKNTKSIFMLLLIAALLLAAMTGCGASSSVLTPGSAPAGTTETPADTSTGAPADESGSPAEAPADPAGAHAEPAETPADVPAGADKPADPADKPASPSAEAFVGPWHLDEGSDLEALSGYFPGTAEFGSGMKILSDGTITWFVGADGATGTYTYDGDVLTADVTGELDGEAYTVPMAPVGEDTLIMTFKGVALTWIYGEGETLRGEDSQPADAFVGPWHLDEGSDLEALSGYFPGAAEFGSGMEILSNGNISWYIGSDGATGTYTFDGDVLTADVTGEQDGKTYSVVLAPAGPDMLTMTFKGVALTWVYGDGGSLRGEG